VPGGGVALLRAKKAVGKLTNEKRRRPGPVSTSCSRRWKPRSARSPRTRCSEGSIVVGKILEEKSETYGFDAQNEEYVDMIAKGIIDPAKVVRTALQDAGSVAGLLVTTEAMVAELAEGRCPAMPAAVRRNGRHGRLGWASKPTHSNANIKGGPKF